MLAIEWTLTNVLWTAFPRMGRVDVRGDPHVHHAQGQRLLALSD